MTPEGQTALPPRNAQNPLEGERKKKGEVEGREDEGGVSAIGRTERQVRLRNPSDAATVTCGSADPGPPPETPPGRGGGHPETPAVDEPGPELTVHRLLLEEGRHGQRPHPGGPTRPGPVRPGSRKRRTKGTAARSCWRRKAGSTGRTRGRRGCARLWRTRRGRSGDRELRHFLEKSLLGGACALCEHACALRV